jgi:hypothetical protein
MDRGPVEVKSLGSMNRTASVPPARRFYRPLSDGRRGNFKYFWLGLGLHHFGDAEAVQLEKFVFDESWHLDRLDSEFLAIVHR